ncbi:VOC family protein [Chroococcus sp. FPU101]|uniref:VOC family protein n=1 Tax=Chroococcus sp. FPU101 TaxID=1974212 RepID=UPI001A8F11B6|nr:VOC family protein [Chroococcus sp. FPU101]GFE70598.1 glyoxalase/bleomycin resistance protein/dioxygenase [Chroococcus sp. FPU101]
MQITQCLHTAILVCDLEKAEYFYGQVLGLTKVDRNLKYLGAWYQIGDYQLHLMVDASFSTQKYNTEKWGRNPHLALSVVNLEEAITELQQHSYPIQMSASGRPALFVHDPDGNIIEISQK